MHLKKFWSNSSFASLNGPRGIINIYVGTAIVSGICFYYTVAVIFPYLCSRLSAYLELYLEDAEMLLERLSDDRRNDFRLQTFENTVRSIIINYEKVTGAFNALQDYFGLKLFVNIVGYTAVLLSGIVCCTVNVLNPDNSSNFVIRQI